jgi:cobalt-zinc-cadmium efflux system outer membrane protein
MHLSQPNGTAFLDNQEISFLVEQELETGGRRDLRTREAQRGVEATRASAQDVVRQLRFDVRRAYMQVVLAKADDEAARTTLEQIDKVLAINRARYEQGELSGVELRRLQVERFRFADDVFASELALRNARSALLALLNVKPLDRAFDTVDDFAAIPGDAATAPAGDAQAAIAQALSVRPDVEAARREQDRARATFQLQHALGKPSITLGAGLKRDFGSNGLAVNVGVPLPIFNTNQGGVARAAAEERQAAARLEAVETAAALEVQQALNGLDVSRRRAVYAEGEYLKNAMEARDIVLASYKNGAATLIDYLDAERSLREALRVRNRTRFDYQVSLFQYEAAVGIPGPPQGKEPK